MNIHSFISREILTLTILIVVLPQLQLVIFHTVLKTVVWKRCLSYWTIMLWAFRCHL